MKGAASKSSSISNVMPVAAMNIEDLVRLVQAQAETIAAQSAQIAALKHQLDWFKRQLFGQKSEQLRHEMNPQQLAFGQIGADGPVPDPAVIERLIAAHKRRVIKPAAVADADSLPFFDETRVPIQTIELPDPAIEGLEPSAYEQIGEKITFKLAQRIGSYVVLKYRRRQHKLIQTQKISCAPAPSGVIEGSRADVSLLAGLLVDKLVYHLPLYRQHQRLEAAHITVSRPWLTQITQKAIGLLEPIYDAQFASILRSRVKAMDETPIKAGVSGPGKMRAAYFWPVYGEEDEICFVYRPDRDTKNVLKILGPSPPEGAVLLSDGYVAYEKYVAQVGLTHAQCWAHSRRKLFESLSCEPAAADEALRRIGELYVIEDDIRKRQLTGSAKLAERQSRARPVVEAFFRWLDTQMQRPDLTPSNPFMKALAYARNRREALQVYLQDADVAIDTNHIERSLRSIPMGRRNWLFCWTELGAQQIGMAQSLLTTCRLHDVDPYEYLVDVLQRVSLLPASQVEDLTPRRWKSIYAGNPLRSDLNIEDL